MVLSKSCTSSTSDQVSQGQPHEWLWQSLLFRCPFRLGSIQRSSPEPLSPLLPTTPGISRWTRSNLGSSSQLVLYEFGRSTISLLSSPLSRDPLAEVWIAIRQRDANRFALSKKSHAILTDQSQLLEVKNDAAIFPFAGDERF